MKKHIFGLALFSFIVGVAVVISGWFAFKSTQVYVSEVSEAPQLGHLNSCTKKEFKGADYADAKIDQAVLDVKTKQLKTFLSMSQRTEKDKNYTILLHFFVKNGKQTKYLSTESIWMNSVFDAEKESLLTSLEWLDNLESFDNLYIVPETSNGFLAGKEKNPPSFNSLTAAPVLLSKGKDF